MTKANKTRDLPEMETDIPADATIEEVQAVSASPIPEPEPEPVDPDAGLPFCVGDWRGLPNYECRYCRYATLDEDAAWLHYQERHTAPTLQQGPRPLIYGPDGTAL